ncbi:MAG: glycoside hydrolase family 31 protein [Clostridiales bacterium]|nr:glycoside hydrolase family 31 protein [Clostridiales bacterium]
MIRRYDYGTPIPTGAIYLPQPVCTDEMPRFTVTRGEGTLSFRVALDEDDQIFGLGETVRGINKRGHRYRAWCSDDCAHTEDKASLYACHNLVIFSGKQGIFGLYVDDPGAVTFDLGYTRGDEAVITCENGDCSAYYIEADTLIGAVKEFRHIIGRSYLPPKWGLGYIQSRWGYSTEEDLREVVRNHRERHIPLDTMSMDIDYMEDFKDFTWDAKKFPDLPGMIADFKADHIRVMPIIDAGVKECPGDPTYDEGMEKDYFVKKADGSVFVGAVWPGHAVFPDFMRDEVRQWFGSKYHSMLEAGVEAFWNDMNEPAIFYSEEGLSAAYAKAEELRGKNIGVYDFFALKDAFTGTANSMEDYRRFYHLIDGKRVRHDRVHNLYGAMMTKAGAQGMKAFNPDKRHLLFSRASFIGAHRDGGVWQGDNFSWWSHILLNLRELPGMNMCGFLYTGADLGGFGQNTTEDLLQRWLQLGVFTPLMRNHAAMGTRDQEIYRFRNWEQLRDTLTVRYALIPYLYSELVKAACKDDMLFRPLAFDYPTDKRACRVEDQLMLAGACMIAPVYEQNARGRYVYLPEDMLLVRLRSAADYDLVPMTKGDHWIDLALNEFPLFIRRGQVIPLSKPAEYVAGVDGTHLTLLGWLDHGTAFTLYDDDGETTHIDLDAGLTLVDVQVKDGKAVARGEGLTLDTSKLIIG